MEWLLDLLQFILIGIGWYVTVYFTFMVAAWGWYKGRPIQNINVLLPTIKFSTKGDSDESKSS